MELGATVCLPRNPLCPQCPIHALCRTRGEHLTTPRKKMQRRQIAYALMERTMKADAEIYMELRPPVASLMPGMWELPEVELASVTESDAVLILRHSITNTNYDVRIARMTGRQADALPSGSRTGQWIRVEDLSSIPLTGLSKKALTTLRILPKPSRQRASDAASSVGD
jgi:A/G-specific adenine glycosylase